MKNIIYEVKIDKTVVNMIKFFRVMIDNYLYWSEHIKIIKSILVETRC